MLKAADFGIGQTRAKITGYLYSNQGMLKFACLVILRAMFCQVNLGATAYPIEESIAWRRRKAPRGNHIDQVETEYPISEVPEPADTQILGV